MAVAMSDPSPHPSEPPSPTLPSSSSKGKEREVHSNNPGTPPAIQSYGLRSNKRSAEAAADIDDEGDITPQKPDGPPNADIPRVQVDEASPPPTRRSRTESSGKVAIGDVCCVTPLQGLLMHAYHSFRTGVAHARSLRRRSASLRSMPSVSRMRAHSVTTRRRLAILQPHGRCPSVK
jgi:hypothetical protein